MKMRHADLRGLAALLATAALVVSGCQPPKSEPLRPVKIAEGEIDPAAWGKAYPVNYDLWKRSADPAPAGKSDVTAGGAAIDSPWKIQRAQSRPPTRNEIFPNMAASQNRPGVITHMSSLMGVGSLTR